MIKNYKSDFKKKKSHNSKGNLQFSELKNEKNDLHAEKVKSHDYNRESMKEKKKFYRFLK